jgi:ankyrin repeat protein
MEDNLEALQALAVLPFFKQLLNDKHGDDGWTAVLIAAAQPKNIEHRSLKFLVEQGADLFQTKADGCSVLHLAAGNGQIHLVDYFLQKVSAAERKSKLNQRTNEGLTPAHFAANMENFDVMSLLLEYGADLTIESQQLQQKCHNVFSELIVKDHSDLLGCVWHLSKNIKRDLNQVSKHRNPNPFLGRLLLTDSSRSHVRGRKVPRVHPITKGGISQLVL